ncbi:helix-turn-helix transcriptional regulator [Oscillatoria sp. FACHB-1406]|uniref:helix-turn-helix domain-containing protein n=1 Tax=Oscillatoria sp. FACHB-1406 TaxID=2692846 RepID=UPI0016885A4E|nr:helix-turn-helix transcriptional regulator [Oscillatoria sp. FACHB-1406]MBD2576578.1 helix-turn-helix transcriptional regulator [Oscillatoria sp. FACHB-1406]
MGRAGKALKQVLIEYKISQNKLAIALDVRGSVVYRWFHEQVDPTGDTIAQIVRALRKLNPEAAELFVRLYLSELLEEEEDT